MNPPFTTVHQLMDENVYYNPAVDYPYPTYISETSSMDAPDIHPVTDMVVQNTDLQASSPTNTCWNQDLLIWPYPPTFLYNPEPFLGLMTPYSSEDDTTSIHQFRRRTLTYSNPTIISTEKKLKRKSMNDIPTKKTSIEEFSRLSKEELIQRVVELEREKQSLEQSQLDVSDEEEVHVCRWDGCYIALPSLDELTNHIKSIHVGSGKPAYYCQWEFCPRESKPFLKRHKMQNHMRTHTGERPFECTVEDCDKKFSRLDSLNTHIKTHSNVRPHVCPMESCNKAYFHSRSLRKHLKSHQVAAGTATIYTPYAYYNMPQQ